MHQLAPTVTVVIPTFNRPALLRRAIESALKQTYDNLEIIVIIDGPDPASRGAIEQILDPRLRFIETSEKVGGSEARNIGARAARGEWIALLDDDDEWLPNKLEKQLAAAGMGHRDGVVVTSRYICQESGHADVVRPRRFPRPDEVISEFMFDYLCYFQTSTFLCSKTLLLRIPFDENLGFFQDMDWFLRLSMDKAFELVIVEAPLCIYHVPAGRSSITTNLNWKDRLEWGRQRRHLLSGKAYSRFILGTCVARASEEGAGWKGFTTLLKEAVVVGSASPYLVTLLCGTYFLSPHRRKQLRDRFFLTKADELAGRSNTRVL